MRGSGKRCVALAVALSALSLRGAAPPPHAAPRHGAFYFWQTRWTADSAPPSTWTRTGFDRLFVRFFDVVPDAATKAPVPAAPIEFAAKPPAGVDVVPVVYIANDALKSPAAEPQTLAAHILTKVAALASEAGVPVTELQIDCDWSDGTRGPYFRLLRELRRQGPAHLGGRPLALGATIRLHQVKYRQRTGIPPVDRGMLMFYNMGHLGDARMSIFNADDAERYVAWIDRYPLPLDVALPLFSWAIQERSGTPVGLLDGVSEADFAGSELFAAAGAGRFTAKGNALFRGRYFYAGDLIRFESMTPELTHLAAALAARHQPRAAPFRTIAFFDLNARTLTRYETGFFKQTMAVFE